MLRYRYPPHRGDRDRLRTGGGMIARVRIALVTLSLVGSALAVPTLARAEPAPIAQSAWRAMKKSVRLANGTTLAYVELGDARHPPLLLLHGYTDSSRSWSLMAPHLANYRLLIPDQRGHGASDAPECCYSPTQYAHDAKLLMDALGVDRAHVVGHSLGSMAALAMAADFTDRVGSIALIGATALVPVKRGDWLFEEAHKLSWPLDTSTPFLREWHPANQPTPIDPAFAEAVRAEYLTIPRHVWRGVMRELASVPVARHAADIRAPVLILSGGKDPLFTAEHHAALVKTFPHAEAHVFPDLGHNLIWERPRDIAARIAEFVASSR
jgi:pimeloyl-ACP methyl ester carboxylesterase